ncbi:ABC transporter permease [Chitinophaga tropicalis]|uniref:ABC transporter permease subunit n=1 Tax=Chitinophaga tropicalis TaxID=2683588 RepID=A0A7K1UAN6_9BACT|nr:ABC transporter permease [Chitinophaga tropicalis]MVT11439.1 ABC transporter permease subunit [Chitinophaga tropicalis]
MKSVLLRSLYAEHLRVKSTVAFKIALLAPVMQVAMNFLIYMFNYTYFVEKNDRQIWSTFTASTWGFWCTLTLPMLIAIQTALVNGLEHNNNGWRNLFALPVPRSSIYAAKLIYACLLIFLSQLLLCGAEVVAGYTLSVIRPQLGFQHQAIPLVLLLTPLAAMCGSMLIIVVHNLVSSFSANFFVSTGAAVVFTLFNLILVNKDELAVYYPWTYPQLAARFVIYPAESGTLIRAVVAMNISLIGAWLLGILGIMKLSAQKQIA